MDLRFASIRLAILVNLESFATSAVRPPGPKHCLGGPLLVPSPLLEQGLPNLLRRKAAEADGSRPELLAGGLRLIEDLPELVLVQEAEVHEHLAEPRPPGRIPREAVRECRHWSPPPGPFYPLSTTRKRRG